MRGDHGYGGCRKEPISDIQADRSMGEPLQAQHRARPLPAGQDERDAAARLP